MNVIKFIALSCFQISHCLGHLENPGPISLNNKINPNYADFVKTIPNLIDFSYKSTLRHKDSTGVIQLTHPDLQYSGFLKNVVPLKGTTGYYSGILQPILNSPSNEDIAGYIGYRCVQNTKMQLAIFIRGSQTQPYETIANSKDWKNNISFAKDPVNPKEYGGEGFAHSGYYHKAQSIFPHLQSSIDGLLNTNDCQVKDINDVQMVLTGHSLGASVGILLLQRLKHHYYPQSKNFFQGLLTGIFMSAPRVADPQLEALIRQDIGYNEDAGTGNILDISSYTDFITMAGLGKSNASLLKMISVAGLFLLPPPFSMIALIPIISFLKNNSIPFKSVGIPIHISPNSLLDIYGKRFNKQSILAPFYSLFSTLEENFLLFKREDSLGAQFKIIPKLLMIAKKIFLDTYNNKEVDMICLMHFGNPSTGYFEKKLLKDILHLGNLENSREETILYLKKKSGK